jgi:hypothetical protein
MNGKFKVWDTVEKKTVPTRDEETQEELFLINSDGTLIQNWKLFNRAGRALDVAFSHYVHVFSTGLKDKNAIEIYEGDICKCEDGISRKVLFGDGCFGFKGTISGVVHQGEFEFLRVEVIGNIHQNPELLK